MCDSNTFQHDNERSVASIDKQKNDLSRLHSDTSRLSNNSLLVSKHGGVVTSKQADVSYNSGCSSNRKRQRRISSDLLSLGKQLTGANDNMETNIANKLVDICEEVSDISSEIGLLRQCKHDTSKQIDILTAIVIKQNKKITHLHNRLLNEEKRSMQQNVLFHNISEDKNECTDKKVISFLKEQGIDESDIQIDVSHRIGVQRKPDAKPRPIVAKMVTRKNAQLILEKTKIKGGKREKTSSFATPQIPEELREQRKKLYSLADTYKQKDGKASVEIKYDHIVVNKQRISDAVSAPSVQDILCIDKHTETSLQRITIHKSNDIQERGSTFTVYTAEVSNPSQARSAYLKVNSLPKCAAATHLISAYRFRDGKHSWNDDGDFGLGRFMYKLMSEQEIDNRIFFLSRDFGGIHIGQRRFDITQQLMAEIMVSGKKVEPLLLAPTATSTPFQLPKQRKIIKASKSLPPLTRMDSTGSSLVSSDISSAEASANEDDIDQTLTQAKAIDDNEWSEPPVPISTTTSTEQLPK